MSDIRVYPHFGVRVEAIRETLAHQESLDPSRLERILQELHELDAAISGALTDPKSYHPEGLKKLQDEVNLLVGRVQNRQIHADLYRLTDSAIDLWLKRPASAEERKSKIRELKARMEDLTNNHRFTREDQRFIALFHACVRGVEKGVLPAEVNKMDVPTRPKKRQREASAEIISIEEIKKRRLEDPLSLAEVLYPMAEFVYRGDYASFFDTYNSLSPQSREELTEHISICGGDIIQLAKERSRDKQHEIRIAQGVLGYANAIMDHSEQGTIYPPPLSIHQMMLETGELDGE